MSLPCAKVCSRFVGLVRRFHLSCIGCRFKRFLYDADFRAKCEYKTPMLQALAPNSCIILLPHCDLVEVYRGLDKTILIVNDNDKMFTIVKDKIIQRLVKRAEKTKYDKFLKKYVELIELLCK